MEWARRGLVEAVSHGIDMSIACADAATRRNGCFFTRAGDVKIKNANIAEDLSRSTRSARATRRNFTPAYLHHLHRAKRSSARGEHEHNFTTTWI